MSRDRVNINQVSNYQETNLKKKEKRETDFIPVVYKR